MRGEGRGSRGWSSTMEKGLSLITPGVRDLWTIGPHGRIARK